MPTAPPTTVLFDLDGTLTDSAEGITKCVAHALTAVGLPVPSDAVLRSCVGPPLTESLERLGGGPEHVAPLVTAFRERFVPIGMFENRLYDGVEELLASTAARGFRMIVATAKPEPFAIRILEHFGLLHYFHAVFGSRLDGGLSDKRELFAHLLSQVDIDPTRALMIGDRRYDVGAGKAYGMRTIGVLWGYGGRAELEEAGADVIAESMDDIAREIARLPPNA